MGYTGTQSIMQKEQQSSGTGGWRGVLRRVVMVSLLAVSLSMGSLAGAFAQSVPAGFKQGKVTATRHQEIQVDLRNYPLHREVKVRDDGGRDRELRDVKRGSYVMIHLKRGRVDQIILILPR